MSDDPYRLHRFLDAQAECYPSVQRELAEGRKRSHWMWFIFPQIDGLAVSETSRFFALRSLEEARAYLAHPVLGARLYACTRLAIDAAKPAERLFGHPDNLKFRSCMTLFALAAPEAPLFAEALERLFAGNRDERTVQIVQRLLLSQ